FSVARNGNLTFVNRVTTAVKGGTLPKSVSISPDGKYLYAVNGLHSNIVGFTINATTGALTSIANSSRPLSSGTFVEPCQIGFSPNGKFIVVTEILTSKIDTWGFNSSTGLPTTVAKVQNSAGPQPFGFSFDKAGHLVVSEMTASTVSTYSISSNGTLTLISNQVPDNGSQACWVAITNNKAFSQQYALISDTASRTLSVYGLNSDGSVTLLHSLILTPLSPTDEALSIDNSFMYVRDGNANELSVWSISSDGTPTQIDPPVAGLPTNGLGMAAR
ncbi:MAG: beta-propeller fold lactonase family protein, partial [Acidobacteriales bacterium]|nr:beta-propeller fold lactonase family protein [Terriglobales bacterium]